VYRDPPSEASPTNNLFSTARGKQPVQLRLSVQWTGYDSRSINPGLYLPDFSAVLHHIDWLLCASLPPILIL
jgi:hypothetical protein